MSAGCGGNISGKAASYAEQFLFEEWLRCRIGPVPGIASLIAEVDVLESDVIGRGLAVSSIRRTSLSRDEIDQNEEQYGHEGLRPASHARKVGAVTLWTDVCVCKSGNEVKSGTWTRPQVPKNGMLDVERGDKK